MNSTESAVSPSFLERAKAGLKANCRSVFGSDGAKVLYEGGMYPGIWLECGPLESLVAADVIGLETAISGHRIFYRHQRPDGQLPAYVWANEAGYSQIQQVTPITVTALALAQMAHDGQFLLESYRAGAAWTNWLAAHRDPRHLDLLEVWCVFDTGHDNSLRFQGWPGPCPDNEASHRPPLASIPDGPRLACDLSATFYGLRKSLAEMALLLDLKTEAENWRQLAERTRIAIDKYCWDPEREFYFDVAPDGRRIGPVGDGGLRVLQARIPAPERARRIFERHILNPKEFWRPYPLPSIAVDDPCYVPFGNDNSWSGAAQALEALRTREYFPYYGYGRERRLILAQWAQALERAGEFHQQIDPETGRAATTEQYSPAMCVVLDCMKNEEGKQERQVQKIDRR